MKIFIIIIMVLTIVDTAYSMYDYYKDKDLIANKMVDLDSRLRVIEKFLPN